MRKTTFDFEKNKERVIRMYVEKKYSIRVLAGLLNTSEVKLTQKLKEWNVKIVPSKGNLHFKNIYEEETI